MGESNEQPAGEWDSGWDEHKLRQMCRLAKLSLAEKLQWLEEAQQVADTLSAQCSTATLRQQDADRTDAPRT